MSRIVIDTKNENLMEAASSCPCNCFRKSDSNEFVINVNECIDCGVCQTVVNEGVIVEESEASEEKIKYNNDNAEKWEAVQ